MRELSNSIHNGSKIYLALFGAAFIAAYLPVIKSLIKLWATSDDYSHGFFIIPVCIYIVWRKKHILSETSVTPSWWGLALAVSTLMVYVISRYAEITTVASFSMIPFLVGAVLFVFGYRFFKELLFPLFMLLFMLPVPSQVYAEFTMPLQLLVSKASTFIGSLAGVSIYREGNVIYLPNHTLQVVRACSGLRSMISLMMLAAVLGFFMLRSNLLRSALFISSVPVAILVNIVRVVAMITAFYYFSYDLTNGFIHTVFGVILFMLALGILATTKGVLSLWERSVEETF